MYGSGRYRVMSFIVFCLLFLSGGVVLLNGVLQLYLYITYCKYASNMFVFPLLRLSPASFLYSC